MSKTKEMYFDHFAIYDYQDMPDYDFDLEFRMWEIKEDRLSRIRYIISKFADKKEEEQLWLN